jgi:hypothetical protein
MEKRGMGHVEAIVTMIIFIAFIIFAFAVFNPLRTNRTLDTTLDYAWREIYEDTTKATESYSVNFDNDNEPQALAIILNAPLWNARVFNSFGDMVLSISQIYTSVSCPSNVPCIGVGFDKPSDAVSVFNIVYGEDFDDGGYSNFPGTGGYIRTIASSQKENMYSEKALLALKANYDSDYSGTKTRFNLPNRVDFGFTIEFDDTTPVIEAKQPVPQDTEVTVREERVKVTRTSATNDALDGKIEFATLRVFVW